MDKIPKSTYQFIVNGSTCAEFTQVSEFDGDLSIIDPPTLEPIIEFTEPLQFSMEATLEKDSHQSICEWFQKTITPIELYKIPLIEFQLHDGYVAELHRVLFTQEKQHEIIAKSEEAQMWLYTRGGNGYVAISDDEVYDMYLEEQRGLDG